MSTAPSEPYAPWAQKAQYQSDDNDALLAALARRNHPTCAWWWGRRIDGSMAVAQCYICGDTMTRWLSRNPPTPAQRERIMRHRRQHLATLPVQLQAKEIEP